VVRTVLAGAAAAGAGRVRQPYVDRDPAQWSARRPGTLDGPGDGRWTVAPAAFGREGVDADETHRPGPHPRSLTVSPGTRAPPATHRARRRWPPATNSEPAPPPRTNLRTGLSWGGHCFPAPSIRIVGVGLGTPHGENPDHSSPTAKPVDASENRSSGHHARPGSRPARRKTSAGGEKNRFAHGHPAREYAASLIIDGRLGYPSTRKTSTGLPEQGGGAVSRTSRKSMPRTNRNCTAFVMNLAPLRGHGRRKRNRRNAKVFGPSRQFGASMVADHKRTVEHLDLAVAVGTRKAASRGRRPSLRRGWTIARAGVSQAHRGKVAMNRHPST